MAGGLAFVFLVALAGCTNCPSLVCVVAASRLRESSNIYKFDKYGHMQCLMLILKEQEGDPGPPGVTLDATAGHPVLSHARLGAGRRTLAVALQPGCAIVVPGTAGCRPAGQSTEI
uniref:Putative secreted protein n=1 Tax=Anopheles darlingi TaxID=43151 RepID=A0A2M4DMB2_ANODA